MPDSKSPRGPVPTHRGIKIMKASEFKAKCLELMDYVHTRHVEVIVTKRGVPVAKLGPVGDQLPSAFGFMKGTVLEADDIVAPDHGSWDESPSDPLNTP
jgi:prevent-host-death family protein